MSDGLLKTNLFSAYDRHLSRTSGQGSPQRQDFHEGVPGSAAVHERGTAAEAEKMLIAQHLGMDTSEDEHLMWIAEMVSRTRGNSSEVVAQT